MLVVGAQRYNVTRPLAFDRKKRLVRKSDFDRAFREGVRARGAILVVVARPNGLEHTRLGLSIGKSIWKSAVKRNRVRRIFRESFRLSYADLPSGLDLVLIAATPRLEPQLEATRRELVHLARKALRRVEERA
jgi:ribonuclease P protein component